jgi:hypothetical protein
MTRGNDGMTSASKQISIETAKALLRHVMEWDSEESTCAGWISDNEFRLWCQVVRDPVVAGEVEDLPEYTWMRELAEVAGGWWVWPDEPREEELCFISMSEWLPIYEQHRQEIIDKYGPGGWEAGLPVTREKQNAFWEGFREAAEKEPKSKTPSRETSAAQLLRVMEDEAEVNWAMSWSPGHEYDLWASVVGDEPRTRRGGSSEPDRLRELANAANGWFMSTEGAEEAEFVPMGRWLVIYRQYVEEGRGKPDGGDTES